MALPLLSLFKNTKLDAVVNFKKPVKSKKHSKAGGCPSANSVRWRGSSGANLKGSSSAKQTGSIRDGSKKSRAKADSTSAGSQRHKSTASVRSSAKGPYTKGEDTKNKITSSVMSVVKTASSVRKITYQVSAGRGDRGSKRVHRLQGRLDSLESNMNRLRLREEQFEDQLAKFFQRKSSISSAIDAIQSKIDDLAKMHKTVSSKG